MAVELRMLRRTKTGHLTWSFEAFNADGRLCRWRMNYEITARKFVVRAKLRHSTNAKRERQLDQLLLALPNHTLDIIKGRTITEILVATLSSSELVSCTRASFTQGSSP